MVIEKGFELDSYEEHHSSIYEENESSHAEREERDRRERRLKWKLDLTVLPLLSLTYFLSSMGRSDLANAKVAGLTKDLNLSAQQYSNLASFFQIGYIVFQLPGTILLRKIGPPYQFGLSMILWGVCTACNLTAKSFGTLLGLRILVGVAEAFIQGAVFYLSFWYTYTELATRGAIFFSTSALAGAFNGLIAYGIEKNLNGKNGWTSWQWLYLIEGILPIGCSFLVIILLPPTPERHHFLFSKEERALAISRSRHTHNPEESKIRPKLIWKPLTEVRFWLITLMYAFNHYVVGSLSNFLPAIILSFGYSSVRSQLMSVIVYACALVGTLFFAKLADRTQRRGLPLLGASGIAVAGLIMLLTITNNKGRLAATCLLALGAFATVPVSAVWMAVNIAGFTKRGSALAIMNMIAQAFSIAGNQAYNDPPFYHKGLASSLGLMCGHMLLVPIMLWAVKRFNDKKEQLKAQLSAEELVRLRAESLDIVGDRHIDFVAGY